MKFLYGDEERFLLDRIKELNRNFDKEERVKLLRMEVKKREKILRRRWKKYRRQKNISKRKSSQTKKDCQIDSVDKDHSAEITDFEHTEEEDDDTQDEGDDPNTLGGNTSLLLLLSQDGNGSLVQDNDGQSETDIEKERKETREETKDTGGVTAKKHAVKAVKDSAVGGMLQRMHGMLSGLSKGHDAKMRKESVYYWDQVYPGKNVVKTYSSRKQANSRERNVKNYRQALKVLGLQVQTNEKQREVRAGSASHYSEQEILLAFQCKFAELSSTREEGQQDLHEAYQILVAAKNRFKKTGKATIHLLRIAKMMNPKKSEKKKKKQQKNN